MPFTPDPKLMRKARAAADRIDPVVQEIRENPALPPETWATKIIDALQGDSDVFWILDEKPGLFDGYNRYMPWLRQIRNSPKFGPQMFASFKARG